MSSTFGCPHCGKTNQLDATFCVGCGTYLKAFDAQSLTPAGLSARPETDETPTPSQESRGQDPALSQPWLRPGFEETDNPPPAPPLPDQPWLRPESEPQNSPPPASTPQRLLGGLQGLLEPLDLTTLAHPDSPTIPHTEGVNLPYDLRRELRQMFAADVPILEEAQQPRPQPEPTGGYGAGLARRNWIYGLVLAGLLMALWVGSRSGGALPHSWPGVTDAYRTIDSLPANPLVLVNWAYDPATAGEMDLASLSVIEHLLEKNAQLLVVSQLPGGPATARRLIAVARSSVSVTPLGRSPGEGLIEGGYLPGGIASLPLLGQSPAQGLPVDMRGRSLKGRSDLHSLESTGPSLLLVLAGRAEDVQRWLEQVQPLNTTPVVAVVGAGADPALRPYVDSGQIAGLVSGYAGGITYRELLANPIPAARQESQRRHITAQNWALVVLLLVVAVGNLAGLAERGEQ
ncbi:MAG: zinc-ribbon domain-containing protein [Caldilineaceae bacterium]|nr:zinc-ribbon domain-containing protein [Caldilineaceae bacterium]